MFFGLGDLASFNITANIIWDTIMYTARCNKLYSDITAYIEAYTHGRIASGVVHTEQPLDRC